MSDTRSQGSSRSRNKARLPLPSQMNLGSGEMDLLSQFSDSVPSKKSSKRGKNLPLPSMQGDVGGDLFSSLLSNSDSKSNTSKSSRRKKLPLPSNGGNESSLLGDFLEPSSSASNKSGKRLAPSFGREKSLLSSGSHTVEGESGAQDLLERLTNLSSRSNESGSKRSVNTNGSRRNLPKPSQVSKGDDLLSMFSNPSQAQEHDYDSENIVYEPVDDDEVEHDEDYFDEGNPPMSPRDTLKEASDVLSILSGHGGGIKPSVLTGRVKYSDEDSKSMSSAGSRDRPESQISGKGYISDKSSLVSNQKSSGLAASLTNSGHEGKQWNQNRAYFLRTAKLREAKKNSPLGKWLPGGSMSSSTRSKGYNREEEEEYVDEMAEQDQALVEHLQLELEEARRLIRSHEQKILALQDEVEAARESCMEEECERVEAEIEKEKVHNENRLLKVQISTLERNKSSPRLPQLPDNTRSMSNFDRPQSTTIAIQTDELRAVKSMGDVLTKNKIVRTSSLSDIENADPKELANEISEAGGLILQASAGRQIAIPFENKSTSFKVEIIGYWMKALLFRESDFSGSLYRHQ